MTKNQVKELLFSEFLKWMRGQTVSRYPNGETDYYDHDVENYCHQVRKRVVEPYAGVDD